jgi:hypothetical protein
MNYDIGKLSLKELRKKPNDEFKCAQRKSQRSVIYTNNRLGATLHMWNKVNIRLSAK